MNIRRLFAIFSLILVGGILVACGADDDDTTPTATLAATEAEVAETTATDEPTEEATDDASVAADVTPAASPMATPLTTPGDTVATPGDDLLIGSPEAQEQTPQAEPVVPVSTEDHAVDASTPVPMASLSGTLTLDGRSQQDYTLSDEGCVGLGEWRQLKPGAQVIVRDAAGTVVDIASLEALESDDTCTWAFSIDVPGADYFSVSIPMVTEVWFDQNDPAVQSGELELFVP